MSNVFLTYGSGGDLSALQNGTASLNVASIINQGLVGGLPVRTSAMKELVSSTLSGADIAPTAELLVTSVAVVGGTAAQVLLADGTLGAVAANVTLESGELGDYDLVSDGTGPILKVKRLIAGANIRMLDSPWALTIYSEPYASPAVSATTWPYAFDPLGPVVPSPGLGFLSFDNNDPSLATEIRINTTNYNSDPSKAVDVTTMMGFIATSNSLYIQQINDAANSQTWNVTGTPVIAAGVITASVTLSASAGTGTTGWPDPSSLIVVVLIDTPELGQRVTDLEYKTQNISVGGVPTRTTIGGTVIMNVIEGGTISIGANASLSTMTLGHAAATLLDVKGSNIALTGNTTLSGSTHAINASSVAAGALSIGDSGAGGLLLGNPANLSTTIRGTVTNVDGAALNIGTVSGSSGTNALLLGRAAIPVGIRTSALTISDSAATSLLTTATNAISVPGTVAFTYGGSPVATNASITLASAGGTETLVNDGVGPALATKGLSAGTGGISLTGAATAVTVDNTLTAQNMGSGPGTVFKQKAGAVLQFNTLDGTNNGLTVSAPSGNVITFDNTLTGSNLGAGTGTLFDSKSGALLRFNSLLAGAGISVSAPVASAITITNTSLNTAVALSSAGGTETLVNDGAGPALATKGLSVGAAVGGGGITLTSDANSITHSLAAGVRFSHFSGTQAVTLANSVVETPLYGTGLGSMTWTATAGTSSKRFKLNGTISSLAAATINFKLRRGGVNLCDYSTVLPALTNAAWSFSATTTHIAGAFQTSSKLSYEGASGTVTRLNFLPVTIAAGSAVWGVSATWGAASASNSITQNTCSAVNIWA